MRSTFRISAPRDLQCQIVINGTVGEMMEILDDLEKAGSHTKTWHPACDLYSQIREVISQAEQIFVCEREGT